MLLNDFKALTKKIEAGLIQSHQDNKEQAQKEIENYEKTLEVKPTVDQSESPPQEENDLVSSQVPFAKIVEVQKGSPADEAGLIPGDQIAQYGDANYLNHQNLKYVIEITSKNQNKEIILKVLRKVEQESKSLVEIKVVPHTWNGPGILGCRFVPI